MNNNTLLLTRSFSIAALCVAAHAAHANEVYGFGGGLVSHPSHERTYTWSLEYRHRLSDYIDLSAAWINEGHIPNHRRDAGAAQLWARASVLDPSFSVAAGAGPYFYFDTTNVAANAPEIDAHGTGVIYSLAATWRTQGPWRVQLRANRIETRNSIDSTSVLLGVGYQLDDLPASDAGPAILSGLGQRTDSSMAVMLGGAIVNSFDSDVSFAKSIEYRHGVGRYIDWSLAWLNEGSSDLGRRNGIVTQLWVVRPVWDERATVEAGIGPLVVVDKYPDVGVERLAGVLSLAASYRISPRWRARVSFSRVFADHPYDSDVILVGAAYMF